MSFTKKLKEAGKMWGKAKERAESEKAFQNDEFEDGRYVVCLSDAKLAESKTSGRLQVGWAHVFTEGEYKGKTKWSYDGLESEDNLMWLGRKLQRLGYEIPEDFDEVQAVLDKITKEKPLVRIRLKTKGEFQNVYIDEVLKGHVSSEESPETSEESQGEEADDEVELVVGATVSFDWKGETLEGEVVEILEDEGKVRVKVDDKVYKVKGDSLTLTSAPEAGEEDVPEEPEVEPDAEEEEASDEVEADEEDETEEEDAPRVTRKSPKPVVKGKKPLSKKKGKK